MYSENLIECPVSQTHLSEARSSSVTYRSDIENEVVSVPLVLRVELKAKLLVLEVVGKVGVVAG